MLMIERIKQPNRRELLHFVAASGLAALTAIDLSKSAAAVESDPLPRVVLEWLGAWSSDDPAGNLAALYDADGSYEDVPSGASVLGPDIERYLREALAGMSLINRYPRTAFAVDGLAVAEQLFWATNQGFVPDAPNGIEFQVYAITIFEHNGRRLHRTTDYYDSASILRQLDTRPDIPYGDCKSG